MIDIEVQKDDNDDHKYRVYYNGASIVVRNTPRGMKKSMTSRRSPVTEIYINTVNEDRSDERMGRMMVAKQIHNSHYNERQLKDAYRYVCGILWALFIASFYR